MAQQKYATPEAAWAAAWKEGRRLVQKYQAELNQGTSDDGAAAPEAGADAEGAAAAGKQEQSAAGLHIALAMLVPGIACMLVLASSSTIIESFQVMLDSVSTSCVMQEEAPCQQAVTPQKLPGCQTLSTAASRCSSLCTRCARIHSLSNPCHPQAMLSFCLFAILSFVWD